jgi:hypothetical protein
MGQSSSNTSLDLGSLEHVGLSSRRYNRKGFFRTLIEFLLFLMYNDIFKFVQSISICHTASICFNIQSALIF